MRRAFIRVEERRLRHRVVHVRTTFALSSRAFRTLYDVNTMWTRSTWISCPSAGFVDDTDARESPYVGSLLENGTTFI